MTQAPGPQDSPSGAATDVDALDEITLWQNTLATEHAVIWTYGLVGATGDLADAAEAELQTHRARRASCIDAVTALGGEPVASAPAYDVSMPQTESAARRLAVTLEVSATADYVALASSAEVGTRLQAASWLRESAVAQTRWGGAIPTLPGFGDEPTATGG
jgi:hypothetical protein